MRLSFDRTVLILAILWYAFTAYHSVGYYHADEHWQIIEFAGFKSGTHQPQELPWEFNAQIRPTLQPTLAYGIFEMTDWLSLKDPYLQTFLLRLLTSIFAVCAIFFFARSCKPLIDEKYWKPFLVLSFFLWFLPFINVRFSSETWSGLFLLIAIALAIKKQTYQRQFVIIGLLLGFSFIFRFQSAIAGVGLILWMISIQRITVKNVLSMLMAGALVTGFGVLVDRWFYGEWVFTPWKYLEANLIEGAASNFGTSSWYQYLVDIFYFSFFPLGIVILAAFLLLLFKSPRNIFIWIILPFLIVHSIIPHKELRFLFPLVNLVPVVIFLALQKLSLKKPALKKSLLTLAVIFFAVNVVALVVASLKPAGIGRMRITEKIHKMDNEEPLRMISCGWSDPYNPWNNQIAKFYDDPKLEYKYVKHVGDLDASVLSYERPNLLVLRKHQTETPEAKAFLKQYAFHEVTRSIPQDFAPILKFYGVFPMKDILVLYKDQED